MTRVAVVGADGRLGSSVLDRLLTDRRTRVTAALVREGSPRIGDPVRQGPQERLEYAGVDGDWGSPDVVFDASVAAAIPGRVREAARRGVALVIAVTGLPSEAEEEIANASGSISILVAPNLSLGATVLARLVRDAANRLPGFHIEITEAHHAGKRDSPSGTALWLAREAAAARNWELTEVARFGREGPVGPRSDREIGIHSLRAGSIPGEHRVLLGGAGEQIELRHVAESRDCFAAGAVEGIVWLASRPPGRYNMEQVVDGR